jgi:hypothetical protein
MLNLNDIVKKLEYVFSTPTYYTIEKTLQNLDFVGFVILVSLFG